ncbi:ornithine cyclodeaminase [Haloactinopolyspora alba]|uniref:Ornithine cyclodeaminase n=1 Tax=Haloactinopolyspora alba TaxID=648780 RepID=A0A2P8DHF0_9ACTN|nr:ornithine cyclodeaminase family protein [Haloactinopolyspora alba]PSK96652.1 ornithine cyclodeaminase [Haloactinopolyspora alba]
MNLPYLDATTLAARLPAVDAAQAIEDVLRGGFDPEADPPRGITDAPSGQFLLMPSATGPWAGVKLATVAPGNPSRGLPRVQAVYVLMDGTTLTPVALLDGTALTSLRTPAVSAAAVRHLSPPDATRLLVFGTGPQAWGHVEALRAVRPVSSVTVVGRRTEPTDEFVRRCRDAGLTARAGEPADVAGADLVACCTTARTPLFDDHQLAAHACVVAVGSHEPDAREVGGQTVRRSTVVVESRASAAREAGDVIMAATEQDPADDADVVDATLAELVTGRVRVAPGRPTLFKSVGMSWEDLALAAAAHDPGDQP